MDLKLKFGVRRAESVAEDTVRT